jgi:putative acetyltransferase
MRVETDNENHCSDFIRLNELWITEYFVLEDVDRELAADPYKIVREGGHILSLVKSGKVIGVCALFKESPTRYQLARMTVDPSERGKGYGEYLLQTAIEKARKSGAKSIYLLSNTAALSIAISLYRKYGFHTLTEGPHPVYARCNIVMELEL